MPRWSRLVVAAKGFQAIATEVANYSNRSLQGHMAAMDVKPAYEGFVAEATKITGLYSDLCKDCYKPFADAIGKKTFMS